MENPKLILLRGDPIYSEALASAALTPGMLVSSGLNSVSPAAAGATSRTFVRENELVGNGIADAYAQNDTVLLMTNRPGDWVYAWLAAGQNVADGDTLSSAGGGLLGASVDGSQDGDTPFEVTFPTPVVAKALETIDNSAGGAVAVRIKVEVL